MSLQGNNINSLKQHIKANIKQLNTDDSLSEQPFFKQPIRKPRIKKLSNHKLLQVLPFYDVINVLRKARAFKKYAERKRTNNNEHTYSTVYFNSLVKTVINRRCHLN